MKFRILAAALLSAAVCNAASAATLQITEWMYNPVSSPGEFVEFSNMGSIAINMAGWSFDDNTRVPGSDSLSALGIVNPGESVIITESTAVDFRTAWALPSTVKVLGGITNNLGRSDEINIYDASNALVDRLTFNDQGSGPVAGPRTQGTSGRAINVAALGANNASQWIFSTVGDVEGAYKSIAFGSFTGGDIGSPGKTSFASPVPLPAAVWLLGSSLFALFGFKRR